MRRVCKQDGLILLLNQGKPDSRLTNYYYRYSLPSYLLNYGYFPNRPWDRIVDDSGFEVVQRAKFINGSLYYQILRNNK